MHKNIPILGKTYRDIENRFFLVENVDLKNNLNRDIQGKIQRFAGAVCESYCCTLQTWEDIWRDKAPRLDPNKMKIG